MKRTQLRKRIVMLSIVGAIGLTTLLPASTAWAYHGCESSEPLPVSVDNTAYVEGSVTQVSPWAIPPVKDEGMWIYAESNDEPGLQRGGRSPGSLYSDPCHESDSPDTLVF